MDFGEECTLDLYAEKGPCLAESDVWFTKYIGVLPGYTCYNFGALRTPVPTQVGICVHDVGSYGIVQTSFIGPVGGIRTFCS